MEEAAKLCDEIVIMDHGKIIAQGTTQQLLKLHFNEQLVRFPKSMLSEKMIIKLEEKNQKIIPHPSWLEISTANVNQTLEILLAMNLDLNYLQVRQRNLEDLFLELTGGELRV